MAKPAEQEKVLAEFNRPDGVVRLKVGVGKNGEPYVDLRNFWLPDEGDGQYRPTKKGVRLHAENLDKLVEAMQGAQAELDRIYKV